MKAFFKTLFGDIPNLVTVGAVVGFGALMVQLGETHVAAYALPPLLLATAAWFACR